MNKKKAIICTIMLTIIVFGIGTALIFVPYGSEISLFDILSPFIVGRWTGEQVGKFYKWLRKDN